MTTCSDPATLDPGVTRCWVFTLENHLDIPLSVTSLTVDLDPDYPVPPSGCVAASLDLPSFSGDLALPASGTASSPGLPIRLTNTSSNQDDCQLTTLHFVFSGVARQPDSAALASTGVDAPGIVAVSGGLILFGVLAVLARRDRLRNEVEQ